MAKTKKAPGKSREPIPAELFENINQYIALGNRIGDSMHRVFSTLVTGISKGKASLEQGYTYTVRSCLGSGTVEFSLVSGKKHARMSVHSGNKDEGIEPGIALLRYGKRAKPFPLSEQGVSDLLDLAGMR